MGSKRVEAEDRLTVRLRIICETLPPDEVCGESTEFGLQDRAGRLHPGHPYADGAVVYAFDVTARRRGAAGELRWGGDYVHGTASAPFVYLSWKRRDATDSPWIRRLKIPLSSLSVGEVERAVRLRGIFEVRVPGPEEVRAATYDGGWMLRTGPIAGGTP